MPLNIGYSNCHFCTRLLFTLQGNNETEHLHFASLSEVENMYDTNLYNTLVNKFLEEHSNYENLIKQKARNNDTDKINLIDRIIISLALCEIFHLDDIPTKVTINEYVQLGKVYTTKHNSGFINRIIENIIQP